MKPKDCGLCLCEPIEVGEDAKSYHGVPVCALCRRILQRAEDVTERTMLTEPTAEQREVCA